MSHYITKTLLKEFLQCPKYARWHVHNKPVYASLSKELYGDMDMSAIGQEVEDLFLQKYPHCCRVTTPFDTLSTMDAIKRGELAIYQPVFIIGSLYVRCDLLVKNDKGLYDIIEIKSKNSIRTQSAHAPLYDDLCHDVSFQKYVLTRALGPLFSGKVSLVYINKNYVRQGMIDADALLIQEDCSDELLSDAVMGSLIHTLSGVLAYDELTFDVTYPYNGENPLLYFGKKMPTDSIFSLQGWYHIRPLLMQWFRAGKLSVSDVTQDDIDFVATQNTSGAAIANYIGRMQAGQPVIDIPAIQTALDSLVFPLCFYDYETVATPIPLFDGYHPWQQIVVQYSMHIVFADGTIEHKQHIISPSAQSNVDVIEAFVRDIGQGYGTYIVWNKSFENGRNDHIGLLYPQYAALFTSINTHTFDLMDIFKNGRYFHPAFGGSASIKKVLPVLTDIDYHDLPIGDGAAATDVLQKLIKGLIPIDQVGTVHEQLCRYCTLDTWAMVKIWEKVVESVTQKS